MFNEGFVFCKKKKKKPSKTKQRKETTQLKMGKKDLNRPFTRMNIQMVTSKHMTKAAGKLQGSTRKNAQHYKNAN